MRAEIEILTRIESDRKEMFNFGPEVMVRYLSYDAARPFLKPEVSPDEWKPDQLTRDQLIADMRGYMDFAWEKALSHRGLSASRSISKMRAWLWLLGDEKLLAFADDDDNYSKYGAPILKAICDAYGIDMPDDEAARRMADGKACQRGCEEGCG